MHAAVCMRLGYILTQLMPQERHAYVSIRTNTTAKTAAKLAILLLL